MRQSKSFGLKVSLLSVAAAAALAVSVGVAQAQYQTNANGHANDANNRYGSGGLNSGNAYSGNLNEVNNQLIYGNTTGLFSFQGNMPFASPGQFQGRLPPEPSLQLQQIAGPRPESGGIRKWLG